MVEPSVFRCSLNKLQWLICQKMQLSVRDKTIVIEPREIPKTKKGE